MSVKTGAVGSRWFPGSTPKIDKLLDVNAESLRTFAATTMLNRILSGPDKTTAVHTAETASGNQDKAGETAEDDRQEVRGRRAGMSKPELPEEGVYMKDLDKGNIVERYKKAADERELQMEGAATLAFAEEDVLERNGIREEDRKEFFADYLGMESEYLVEGALLTCTQATEETVYIDVPGSVTGEQYFFEGKESETENPLLKVTNPANDGSARYATVTDTEKGKNIKPFRNCRLTNKGGEAKVLEKRKDCQRYGTCYALMDLCDEWVNVQPGAEYGTAEGEKKNCINMLSHLGCYQGGMIFPLDSGQGELENEGNEDEAAYALACTIVGEKAGELTQEQKEANARYIYNFFSEKGWSKEAICGMLGNFERECHMNPGAWQVWKDIFNGYGLAQWSPAKGGFLGYTGFDADTANELAKSDPTELMDKQLEYLLYTFELKEDKRWLTKDVQTYYDKCPLSEGVSGKMTVEEFSNSKCSPGDLALIFQASYERSGDETEELEQRVEYAEEWYDYFSDYGE